MQKGNNQNVKSFILAIFLLSLNIVSTWCYTEVIFVFIEIWLKVSQFCKTPQETTRGKRALISFLFKELVLSETDQNQQPSAQRPLRSQFPAQGWEISYLLFQRRVTPASLSLMRSFPSGPRSSGWLRDSSARKGRLHLEQHCAQNQMTKSCASPPPATPRRTNSSHRNPVGEIPWCDRTQSPTAHQSRLPDQNWSLVSFTTKPNCCGPRTPSRQSALRVVQATQLLRRLLDQIRELQPARG